MTDAPKTPPAARQPFRGGERVAYRYAEPARATDPAAYRGVVTHAYPDGRIVVRFDNGEQEQGNAVDYRAREW